MGLRRVAISLFIAVLLGAGCSLAIAWAGAAYMYVADVGDPVMYWDKNRRFYTGDGTLVCDLVGLGSPTCGNDPEPPAQSWPPQYMRDQAERTNSDGRVWGDRIVVSGWPFRSFAGGVEVLKHWEVEIDGATIAVSTRDIEPYIDQGMLDSMTLISELRAADGLLFASGERMGPYGFKQREDLLLPWHPIWPGLAMNVAVFGGVWWIAMPGRRFARAALRARRGRCLECGYDLKSDFDSGCPECGWGRDGVS